MNIKKSAIAHFMSGVAATIFIGMIASVTTYAALEPVVREEMRSQVRSRVKLEINEIVRLQASFALIAKRLKTVEATTTAQSEQLDQIATVVGRTHSVLDAISRRGNASQ